MLKGPINTFKMCLSVIFIVKKALHVLVTSSLVDFTSWVVGCCCSHCKDYSRASCADHRWGDSRGVPLSQVRVLAVGRGRWRARESLEGRVWWWGSGPGSWLDASPLAPPLPCTLAAEDSPRLHGNSWLPHLGEGNIDGNLSTFALKEKQQSLSPGASGKVTSTLSVPCLAWWSSAGWPHSKSLAIQILVQEILPSEDRCEGARKLGSGGNSSLGS